MKTLSDKMIMSGGSPAYNAEDIKEFIRALKEEFKITMTSNFKTRAQWQYPVILEKLNYKIDMLAGDKLI